MPAVMNKEHRLALAVREEQAELRKNVWKGKLPQATDGDRLTVLIVFAQTKSVNAAAQESGVSYETAKEWIDGATLEGGLEDIYAALRLARYNQINALVDLTTIELRDRLLNGDTIVVDGMLRLAPVKARDLSAIRKDLVDEVDKLAGKVGAKTQQDTRLLAIAEELQGYITEKVKAEIATPTVDVAALLEEDHGS